MRWVLSLIFTSVVEGTSRRYLGRSAVKYFQADLNFGPRILRRLNFGRGLDVVIENGVPVFEREHGGGEKDAAGFEEVGFGMAFEFGWGEAHADFHAAKGLIAPRFFVQQIGFRKMWQALQYCRASACPRFAPAARGAPAAMVFALGCACPERRNDQAISSARMTPRTRRQY